MNNAKINGGHAEHAAKQQFLTFKLAGEEYGVGILTVQEIRGWSAVTAIPHSPPWVLGVIDLRGVVGGRSGCEGVGGIRAGRAGAAGTSPGGSGGARVGRAAPPVHRSHLPSLEASFFD